MYMHTHTAMAKPEMKPSSSKSLRLYILRERGSFGFEYTLRG